MRVEGLAYNKGRCFVEYSTRNEAETASEAVNGKLDFKGKILMTHCGIAGAM